MYEDILKAVKKHRDAYPGVGPTLRELAQDLGRPFSSVQVDVMTLLDDNLLSAFWLEKNGKRRLAPRSLDITEEGLKLLEDIDEGLETV